MLLLLESLNTSIRLNFLIVTIGIRGEMLMEILTLTMVTNGLNGMVLINIKMY